MDERRSDEPTPGENPAGRTDDPTAGENPASEDNPTGGDETTEDQLEADNAVEQDTLETLDPDSPPA